MTVDKYKRVAVGTRIICYHVLYVCPSVNLFVWQDIHPLVGTDHAHHPRTMEGPSGKRQGTWWST